MQGGLRGARSCLLAPGPEELWECWGSISSQCHFTTHSYPAVLTEWKNTWLCPGICRGYGNRMNPQHPPVNSRLLFFSETLVRRKYYSFPYLWAYDTTLRHCDMQTLLYTRFNGRKFTTSVAHFSPKHCLWPSDDSEGHFHKFTTILRQNSKFKTHDRVTLLVVPGHISGSWGFTQFYLLSFCQQGAIWKSFFTEIITKFRTKYLKIEWHFMVYIKYWRVVLELKRFGKSRKGHWAIK